MENEPETKDPLGLCSQTHVDESERTIEFGPRQGPWIIVPCYECRPVAHIARITELKAQNQKLVEVR
jgi:hypothetical protein